MMNTKIQPVLNEKSFVGENGDLINAIESQITNDTNQKESVKAKLAFQEQIRHADRLATIGQLAAGIVHELNEPLGSILGFAQLATKSPRFPEQAKRDVDKIIKASLYAREVIKKILIFVRELPPKKTRINLNKVVEESLYFFADQCSISEIELVCSLSPVIPEIFGDHVQLKQVLLNLVVNAIQAMPEGGKLTIKTCILDNLVSLIVEDTGSGICETIINKIFIPFFTTKDGNEGTGLGLSVVHSIVFSHNGHIKVESVVGQGSRFEVQLPVT